MRRIRRYYSAQTHNTTIYFQACLASGLRSSRFHSFPFARCACSTSIVRASVPASAFTPPSSSLRYAVCSVRHLVTLATHYTNPLHSYSLSLVPVAHLCTASLTPSQEQHADHIWLLARIPPARQQGGGTIPAKSKEEQLSACSCAARLCPCLFFCGCANYAQPKKSAGLTKALQIGSTGRQKDKHTAMRACGACARSPKKPGSLRPPLR